MSKTEVCLDCRRELPSNKFDLESWSYRLCTECYKNKHGVKE